MVAGDAAGFVFSNGIVIQGMNYAVRSGLEAAETALAAKAAGDATARGLAEYDRRLASTGILADFRDFAGMDRVKWNARIYSAYPRFAAQLFHEMTSGTSEPKQHMRRLLLKAQRAAGLSMIALVRDGVAVARDL